MLREGPAWTDDKRRGNDREASLWNQQHRGLYLQGGPLEWWYRLAAPMEPKNSTAQDRERVRAGRLSSIILLIMFIFGLVQVPNALASMNHFFLFVVLIAMTINIGVFVLNRWGWVMTSGIIMVIVVETAFITVVLTSPLGLSSRSLTTFYLIVLTELMAVSLLPPRSVFIVALCNALFTWAAISFLHHTPDFQLTTPSAYYSALASPIVLQAIVAVVTYLWAQGAQQAIERAERVAALERALAERDRIAAEQKIQLENGIQHILQTHIQVANGNFEARAPLARDNVLWQVAIALNNLLARLQRTEQTENEFQRVKLEIVRAMHFVQNAKARRSQLQLPRSGTILDPLAQELSGTYIDQG